MEEILHQLTDSLSHYLQFFSSQVVNLPDFFSINSIVDIDIMFFVA